MTWSVKYGTVNDGPKLVDGFVKEEDAVAFAETHGGTAFDADVHTHDEIGTANFPVETSQEHDGVTEDDSDITEAETGTQTPVYDATPNKPSDPATSSATVDPTV